MKNMHLNQMLLIYVITNCCYKCVVSQDVDVNRTMTYLKHFGFVKGDNESMKDGIERLQKYAGFFVTGVMNAETQKIMEIPRCGSEEPEVIPQDTLKGAFQSSRWKNNSIPYIILDYPSYLDKNKVDELMLKAFSEWAKHIDRSFRQVMSPLEALINITFTYTPRMANIDENIIVAKAKFPIFGGGIQFSSLQNWTTDPKETNRTSLYQVALHEIGHSLGLLHSSYPSSIMSPYLMHTENVQLHNNDKQRIKFLYNIDEVQSTHRPNLTKQLLHSWRVPSLCSLTKFDAIIAKSDSEIYVFNDDQFWLLEGWTDWIVFTLEYPMSISKVWKELPSHIDAAYVHLNGEIYFFKGSQCWKYVEDTKLMDGYPRRISGEFPGIPNDIDAAMAWQDNHTYFFKGNQYWRFDEQRKTAVLEGYPKAISSWGDDIPNDLNAVFFFHQHNYETYFFKDMVYYKHKPIIGSHTVQYPRSTAFWWFMC